MSGDTEKRRCVFCDSDGPLTREHAIPRWLGEVLHDMEPDSAGAEWRSHYTAGGLVERDRQHDIHRPVVVVRAVCEACNTGWMAALEGRVKPIMEPMVRGQRVTLSPVEQLEVATWASKTVFALEAHEPTTALALVEDRQLIRTELRPPFHHRVRLAHRDEVGESLVLKMLVAQSEDAKDDRPDTFASLLGIGFLLIQVWGGHGADTGPGLAQVGTKIGRAVMIWPPVPVSVEWPPVTPVREEDFDEFAREVVPWADDSPDLAEWRAMRRLTDEGAQ